jgi:lipopolysaccharide biosynthesis protein
MLCWANENWTRVWDGGDKSILLEQKYSEEDDREHIRSLIPYFKDERYIKIGGKPVFAVYKSTLLPNAKTTTDIWREEAAKEGLELYLCRFEAFGVFGEQYITEGGFDAGIEFQPFSKVLFDFKQQLSENKKHKYFMRLISKIKKEVLRKWSNEAYTSYISKEYGIVDYTDFIQYAKNYQLPKYKSFPGITPSWDNSARRRQNYFIMKNATPELYKEWLQYIAANFTPHSNEENFIFINAWNEWAEGNHLEPCQKWGLDYLKATQDALV